MEVLTFSERRNMFKRRTHNSLSLAAAKTAEHLMNGWTFWRFEQGLGDWVRLRELRR